MPCGGASGLDIVETFRRPCFVRGRLDMLDQIVRKIPPSQVPLREVGYCSFPSD